MNTETKSLTIEKMDEAGHGLARIATLAAIDHDGDTYLPGAFSWKEGGHQWVSILPAHDRGSVPLGKARVYEDTDAAFAELHLNLASQAGKDWHAALKFDVEKGVAVQEWSYGFGVLDKADESRDGKPVRVLKRLVVHEVSPVVRGAGIGTGTLALKSRRGFGDQIDQMIADLDDILDRAGSVKALRDAENREMSKARIDQLAAIRARLDSFLSDAGHSDTEKTLAAHQAELERMAADFITGSARRRLGR
ncbi:MAG: HK97 family phage prohead protease [Nitratireductor sp.]